MSWGSEDKSSAAATAARPRSIDRARQSLAARPSGASSSGAPAQQPAASAPQAPATISHSQSASSQPTPAAQAVSAQPSASQSQPAAHGAGSASKPLGIQINGSLSGQASGRATKIAVDAETLARLAKANKRMEKLLQEKLGSDFFGTISYEAIFANGQIVQINVTGTEKIR
jgi:hypothetical protein